MDVLDAGQKDFDVLFFSWAVTNWCNYSCSYCSSKNDLSTEFSRKYLKSDYKLVLARLARLESKFIVDIEGGETSLNPNLPDILNGLFRIPNCIDIRLNTNLSRSLRFYETLPQHERFLLSASYHSEHHNEAFIEKCIALKNRKFHVNVSLNDRPEYWPNILKMMDRFDEHGVTYRVDLLHSMPTREIKYTDEAFATFGHRVVAPADKYRYRMSNGETEMLTSSELVSRGLDKFTGYQCTPLNYSITFDGSIINSCTKQRMPIMIKREHTHVPVTCEVPSCSCDSMYNYYKEKQ